MLDALKTLMNKGNSCCSFYDIITGGNSDPPPSPTSSDNEDAPVNKGKERAPDPNPDNDEEDADDEEDDSAAPNFDEPLEIVVPHNVSLNESQMLAVKSWDARLSLIWGPPGEEVQDVLTEIHFTKVECLGTGKTTVVVDMLRSILLTFKPKGKLPKIIMTASTHNGEQAY